MKLRCACKNVSLQLVSSLLLFLVCGGASSLAEEVIAKIPAGPAPRAVAVNSRTDRIYVVNEAGAVTVIDGATDSIVTSLTVGSGPVAIAVNTKTDRAYVANQFGLSVSVIDGVTNSIEATLNMSPFGIPVGVAVDSRRNLVYVLNGDFHSGVIVVSGDTNQVIGNIQFSTRDCVDPVDIAVNPKTNRLYVTCPAAAPNGLGGPANNLLVIDGSTRSTSVVTVGGQQGPLHVAVNPKTDLVYVTGQGPQGCGGSGSFFCEIVSVIDGSTNTVVNSFETGTVNGTRGFIALNPKTYRIYVINEFSQSLTVIDAKTNQIVDHVGVGPFPFGMAANVKTNLLYVANAQGNSLSVIAGPHSHVHVSGL
jgi:YVTN family beta-propeller protein